MFTEVAPGIFSVDHQVVEGKNGIVFGSRVGLAIDTGNTPEEGRAMAAFLQLDLPTFLRRFAPWRCDEGRRC